MEAHPSSKRWLQSLLLLTDLIGLGLAYSLAYWLRLGSFDLEVVFSQLVLTFAAINLAALYLLDLYSLDPQTALWKRPLQTLGAAFVAGCAIILTVYVAGAVEFSGVIGRGVLIGAQFLFALIAASSRFLVSKWLRKLSRRSRWLVLGNEEVLRAFVQDLSRSQVAGLFAFLTPDGTEFSFEKTPEALSDGSQATGATAPNGTVSEPSKPAELTLTHRGSWIDLERASDESWSGIIVCAGNTMPEAVLDVLMHMRLRGVRVIDLADFYEMSWYKVPAFYLQRSWFAMSQGFQLLHNPIGLRLKRLFDGLVAAILLLLSSPVLLFAMLAVKLESRGPVIFKQTRVGENDKHFTVYKLRSMRIDAEKDGAKWAAVKDNRVTRVGAFIRATRIDELPQLVNVLNGDMSFIGPRPERPEFTGLLEKEIPFYGLRHILRPGVTGWAQVMYPYGASVEDAREKLQYDLYYIKNYSLLLDAAIIFKTVRVVLFGKGR